MNNFFNKKGFTLIELLTSMAIFLIIVGGASGILIFSIQAQKRASASQELLSQTSFLIEYMSRAFRMARKDVEAQCLSEEKMNYQITRFGQGIKFLNYQGQCQEFYLEEDQLKEKKGDIVSDLTSDDLQVESFNIIDPVGSWSQYDDEQPRITFFLEIKGRGGREELQSEIKIQTTISQRQLDVQY